MNQTNDLFHQFPSTGENTWRKNIERFLKGKPIDSLTWSIDSQVNAEALYRRSTLASVSSTKAAATNTWSIGNKFSTTDLAETNKNILGSLAQGVNSLSLNVSKSLSVEELELLLKNVYTNMVQIYFELSSSVDIPLFLDNLQAFQEKTGQPIQGGCNLPPSAIQSSIALQTQFTYFTCESKATEAVDSLVELLEQGKIYLETAIQHHLDLELVSTQFRFKFQLTDNYLLEIARLRAFRRLWWGLLEAYDLQNPAVPHLWASTCYTDQSKKYWNMIASTAQAMAAVIGGADTLVVTPSDGYAQADDFSLRIARNVQHLLENESYLDRVIDPAAGSYYLENLSISLQKSAWSRFIQKQEKS
ncbi:MAG: methylmalonyl-CoA mutase family protein [Saprospiraceae bacterium]|nr:methylmalonyl-CoA mutase family protein [Saprospiraceae bacterium]